MTKDKLLKLLELTLEDDKKLSEYLLERYYEQREEVGMVEDDTSVKIIGEFKLTTKLCGFLESKGELSNFLSSMRQCQSIYYRMVRYGIVIDSLDTFDWGYGSCLDSWCELHDEYESYKGNS